GWMKTDYEQSGMTYDRPGLRIERLTESIDVVEGLFADGPFDYDGQHYKISGYDGLPKPVQKRPPLLLGGGGKRMLTLAAQRADIVGVTANLRSGEVGPDAIADSMGAAYDQKLEWVKAAAGDRFDDIEISSLTMAFMVTDDQAGSLAMVGEMFGQEPDIVAQSPAVLVGSIDEICETLQARRERWGFSYPVFQAETLADLDNMAQVVAKLAGT
ncbi:MAG: LLM class flavin-dependent oxidoreductase, partial [Acidimicrobiales bacterium]|nr:LLM class flavin-dependent oxidoreductase [Acidimicrobiales bacterium]